MNLLSEEEITPEQQRVLDIIRAAPGPIDEHSLSAIIALENAVVLYKDLIQLLRTCNVSANVIDKSKDLNDADNYRFLPIERGPQ